jgi:membrane-associated phospholipid phosphatase
MGLTTSPTDMVPSVESRTIDGSTDRRQRGRVAASLLGAAGTSLVLLGLLVLVTMSVELGWWSRFDTFVYDWATSQRGSSLWHALKVVWDVADPEFTLPATVGFSLLASWRLHRWSIAAEAAFRVALLATSVLLLKPLLAVPSPRDSIAAHGGAFPSGHTTTTVVCLAMLLSWARWPRSMIGRVAVSAVVVSIVGGSVIYVGYHYVSDVVGGLVLGLLLATLPLPSWRRSLRT